MYEEIVGPNPDNDGIQAIYDACTQINDRLLDDCDLKDFLDFDMQYVRIHPDYLV